MKQYYDVIVVGGGFAGVAAAISAAREGRSVRLIEKYNCLGGAAAYDLVNPFMRYWTYTKDKTEKVMLSCGLFLEIVGRIDALSGFRAGTKGKTCFNEEVLKLVLNRMAMESGVSLLYQTYVTGAEVENGTVKAITVSNVSGSSRYTADCFIDATGDANLAMLAGFPYRVGRESDGLCQPMTLCFRVGGIDKAKFEPFRPKMQALYKEWQAEGKLSNPRENVLCFRNYNNGVIHFNTTRVTHKSPTDPFALTEAEITAREQVYEMMRFLREAVDGCENARLLSTALHIGIRESRRVIGDYVLCEKDLISLARFEDVVAVSNYAIDIHSPDGSGTSHYYFPPGEYYTIPYRSLIPSGVSNLLVAGRCISSDHGAQASYRIMPVVCCLGEAAGVAISLAVKYNSTVREVNVSELQSILKHNGAYIGI